MSSPKGADPFTKSCFSSLLYSCSPSTDAQTKRGLPGIRGTVQDRRTEFNSPHEGQVPRVPVYKVDPRESADSFALWQNRVYPGDLPPLGPDQWLNDKIVALLKLRAFWQPIFAQPL